jgi:Pentapeptide repeats (8 copies)
VLAGADLRGASLRSADLTAALLEEADLKGADLCGSLLDSARMNGATLAGALLEDASLKGASLRFADLEQAVLEGADLTGTDLWGAQLAGAELSRAIAGACLQDANLSNVDLTGANLTGATLNGASLRGARLVRADLRGASLAGADLTGAPAPAPQSGAAGPQRLQAGGGSPGWRPPRSHAPEPRAARSCHRRGEGGGSGARSHRLPGVRSSTSSGCLHPAVLIAPATEGVLADLPSLATSATVLPSASSRSASRSLRTTCSGVCFLPFTSVPPRPSSTLGSPRAEPRTRGGPPTSWRQPASRS